MTTIPPWVLSADTHVVEPPDLFVRGVSSRFRDVAPRSVMVDGVETWLLDDTPRIPVAMPYKPGDRFLPAADRPPRRTFADDVDRAAYEPAAWLDALTAAGIWGGVVFPSQTLAFYFLRDSALLEEVLRAYQDWVEGFAAHDPARIKPVAPLNVEDPAAAARALEALVARGFCGAAIPVVPGEDRYTDQRFDVLWEAAAGLGVPLHMHIIAHRSPNDLRFLLASPSEMVNSHDGFVRIALSDMVLSGVFDRHPGLTVVSVEYEAAWVPHWLQRMDWHYTQNLRFEATGALHRNADGRLPSDVVRDHVRVSFTEDRAAVRNRDLIGLDVLLWGSDFPHAESVFPDVRGALERQMVDVPDAEVRQLTLTNVADLYGFEVPAAAPAGATS